MKKVSEHLKEMHEAAIAHHAEMEKSERRSAEIQRELHKADGLKEGDDSPHNSLAKEHEVRADLHKAAAESHAEMAESCAKSARAELEKSYELRPDGVRGTYPGVTLVPRHGSPTMEEIRKAAQAVDTTAREVLGLDVVAH